MANENTIRVYISSVSSAMKIKKNQSRIISILDCKKIPYEVIDIAASEEDKIAMREKSGKPTAIPPQIFRGDVYLGDYDDFDNAVEGETIMEFFGIDL